MSRIDAQPESPDAATDVSALLRKLVTLAESGPAEGLDRAAGAAYLGISLRKFDDLHAAGLLPEPASMGLGNCPRWSRTILRAWMIAGAPARGKWRLMEDSALRRIGGVR